MLDYIIVGAGLSGISLAEELISRGKTLKVFENHSQSSSTVAGGIFNPVILKRFTLAWNAGDQLDIALPFYQSLEEKLGVKLIYELPVYRKFNSVEEQNNWFTAMDKPKLEPFLDPKLTGSINPNVPSGFSFGRVRQTGKIDTALLIDKYRSYLQEMDCLVSQSFDHNELSIEEGQVNYKNIKAQRIIFCEGFGMKDNPFFSFLPMHGNKGEYIIIKAPALDLKVAVKSSVFILPLGNDLYKVGATYDSKDQSSLPTKGAREQLSLQLKKMLTCNFEVVDQVAGIRPASRDRKPLVGQHPEHLRLYCCNGFGSRGVLMAPSIARELAEHIENGKPLDPEIDLKRYDGKV